MKPLKIAAIVVLGYIGIVVVFETLLGTFQPSNESTLVLTTFDEDGAEHDRVLSSIELDDRLYVAANHWPRAWYGRALESPEVRVTRGGETREYMAVPISGSEHERVMSERELGVGFRILTGFPPRYFIRLDPRQG